MSKNQLNDRYEPKEVEARTYKFWTDNNYFAAEDLSTKPPFAVILPPPNVTGQLHIGHALNHSFQDILTRWKRMSGFNAMWLPGTDHAGIATQNVVEKKLAEEGLNRKEMGREAFVEKIWEWKEKYGHRIVEQMESLGESCDWDRLKFTLDDDVSMAVKTVFVDLYNKGRIYKGTKLINWSPKLESALSDLEVDHKEIKGTLFHIQYPISGSETVLTVATTRPETLLGDVAVAVHPEDERYKALIGKNVKLPLTKRAIPIIADEYVDPKFGSGVVKITPAHDFNDYEIGVRHSLPMINILNKDGTLNENGGDFQGFKTQEARKKVVEALTTQGLLIKEEPHTHSVGHCSRTGVIAEPLLSEQWFLKMQDLAGPAKAVVENGTITIEPESWTKVYLHWLNNIQDWCISRQLWWGHRIPVWYCEDCQHINVSVNEPTVCSKCKSNSLRQEEDVLDTWFSSALWPFSTLGWPNKTEAMKTFYPTDVLVTGHDIIFFWVARMVMMGLEFLGDVPFRKVVFTGLVRNEQGQKMSKSLGNAIDPIELIGDFGADSLRFTLAATSASGRDMKFSMQRLEGYRNFMNKVWNATRFALSNMEDFDANMSAPKKNELSDVDQWIIYKTGLCEHAVNEHLNNYRFAEAANSIYEFVWHEFCDWYIEFSKPVLYGDKPEERKVTQYVMAQTLNRICRLLHPFTPFITEEIFSKLPINSKALIVETYPTTKNDKTWLAFGEKQSANEVDLVCNVISAIRNIRGENRIKPGEKLKVRLRPGEAGSQKVLQANKDAIQSLARLEECIIQEEGSTSKCAVVPLRQGSFVVDVIVYLEGVVDLEEERKRILKSIEKFQGEMQGLSRRLSNDSFTKNAPVEVVETGRAQLKELEEKISTLQSSLTHLN